MLVLGERRGCLPPEIAAVLPAEGAEYYEHLDLLRFRHRAGSDHMFLRPESLMALLLGGLDQRGHLGGDDRLLMQSSGIPGRAFGLPENYRYLQVPAEGRVGRMSLHELPEWVPVSVGEHQGEEHHHRHGTPLAGRRRRARQTQLCFSVDSDFQRLVNYATLIVAPNWFPQPTTTYALLDVIPGPPPHGIESLPANHRSVRRAGWGPGQQITVAEMRTVLGDDTGLLLGCHVRNLPGS